MIRLNVFASAYDKAPAAQDDLLWQDVAREIEILAQREAPALTPRDPKREKELLLAFNFCELVEPYNVNANVAEMTAMAIDVDRCNVLELSRALQDWGVESLVYGSPSDDATKHDARRVRVLAPLSRPLAPDEVKHARRAFAEAIGIEPGQGVEGAEAVSQVMFVGRLAGTPERFIGRTHGATVDADELVGADLTHDWKPIAPSTDLAPLPGLADVSPDVRTAALIQAMAAHWEAPGEASDRRQTLRGLGGYLARRGWPDEQIAAAVAQLPTARPEAERVRIAIECARQARLDPDNTAGWSTLAGWSPQGAQAIESVAKHPLEPHDFAGVWSDYWANYYASHPELVTKAPGHVAPADATAWAHPPDPNAQLVLDVTRQGTPRSSVLNAARVLEHVFGERIRYEECAGRIVCAGIDESLGRFPDGEWTDAHTTAFMIVCNTMNLELSAAVADRAIEHHAKLSAFNALRDWLEQAAAAWDGAPRVDTFFATYFSAPDDAASAAASRVFLLSLVARGMLPGCKVDTCPVLMRKGEIGTFAAGGQGLKKSTGLRALVGAEWFADSPLPIGDKDAMQNIRGKWLWEFQEHGGSFKERNQVKAFLSTQVDRFRASYGRHTEDAPRTCVFASSSNDPDPLNDPTGARRWLPVPVGAVQVAWIAEDREQILGEACARLFDPARQDPAEVASEFGGEQYWPNDAETLALEPLRAVATEHDAWSDLIGAWCAKREAKGREPFTLAAVMADIGGALPANEATLDMRAQKRAGSILRALGYESVRGRMGNTGARATTWAKR